MRKNCYAIILIFFLLTSFFVSCSDYHGIESNGIESLVDSFEIDFSNSLSQDDERQHNNSFQWEIPEDIENPSQGLELVESYSKEFGDCYIVVGIGTCEDVDIVIPSTVNGKPVLEIANSAFENNNNITSVYCGNRVTKIGKFAFRRCTRLKKVIIPDSVTSLCEESFAWSGVTNLTMSDRITTMERAVFTMCPSLKSVKLPYSLTSISNQTFAGCSVLADVELSPNIVSISYHAFVETALKSIMLPASLESVDPTAFESTMLSSFEVDEQNPYLCSVDGVLYSKDMSTLIAYPQARGAYTVPDGVKMIDTGAFFKITYEVTLPDSTRTISEKAFFGHYQGHYTVNVKNGISFIDDFAFTCLEGRVTINFEGTKEEWNAIGKAECWYVPYEGFGSQNTTVKCSDGTLTFNYDPGY